MTEGLFQLGYIHDFVVGGDGGGNGSIALKWYLLAAQKGYFFFISFSLLPFLSHLFLF